LGWLRAVGVVARREVGAYLAGPLAFVFIAAFLLALGVFTWELGRFFDTGAADLAPFFAFHPWLYVVFMPAIGMGLWAEERGRGTLELLLTLPLPVGAQVTGKFLAAWGVALTGLALSLPMWWTVNFLGEPDNTAIALTYLMSALMAGAYLAVSAALSALSSHQVIAFVTGVIVCFVLTAAGLPVVQTGVVDALGPWAGEAAASLSVITHFEAAQRGVLELRAVAYFLLLIATALTLNALWVSARRSGS
jgi:ABC-2 type transport system permease protein